MNNNTLNTKAPENIGGLTAKNTPSPTVYLGKTLDVIGDDVWTLSLAPKGVDAASNGVTVYHKDAVNRYAFLRGIGYEITISSYSKMAIVVKLKSQEAKTFVLKASVKKGDLESVMTVNNRFWYASKINDITENKDAKNKTAEILKTANTVCFPIFLQIQIVQSTPTEVGLYFFCFPAAAFFTVEICAAAGAYTLTIF